MVGAVSVYSAFAVLFTVNYKRIVLVHLGRGSVTTTARQPCCDVSVGPVGRARDQTDEVHDRHDRLARWRAEMATESALRVRTV